MSLDQISYILSGFLILLFGRNLFWVFVGIAGFLSGLELAPLLFFDQPEIVALAVGFILGGVGIVLAIFFQRVAVALAGMLGGGLIAIEIVSRFFPGAAISVWVLFVCGAIIGGILMTAFFDWVLIIFSAMLGSGLILKTFILEQVQYQFVYMILVFLGVIIQSFMIKVQEGGSKKEDLYE